MMKTSNQQLEHLLQHRWNCWYVVLSKRFKVCTMKSNRSNVNGTISGIVQSSSNSYQRRWYQCNDFENHNKTIVVIADYKYHHCSCYHPLRDRIINRPINIIGQHGTCSSDRWIYDRRKRGTFTANSTTIRSSSSHVTGRNLDTITVPVGTNTTSTTRNSRIHDDTCDTNQFSYDTANTTLMNLFNEFHASCTDANKKEKIRSIFCANPTSVELLSWLEQEMNTNDLNNIDTTISPISSSTYYSIWENIDIEILLQLRLDMELYIEEQRPFTTTTTIFGNRCENQNQHPRIEHNEQPEYISIIQRWTKVLVHVLIHFIPQYVSVRPIIGAPVDQKKMNKENKNENATTTITSTHDLLKVATVHDEIYVYYNPTFNPFIGYNNRVYGVYYTNNNNNIITQKITTTVPTTTNPTNEEIDARQRNIQVHNTGTPIVILCVSLQSKIPQSLREIFCSASTLSTTTTLPNPLSNDIHVATFYSILNIQHQQYSKLKLGEHLIHEAVRMLKNENQTISSINDTTAAKTMNYNSDQYNSNQNLGATKKLCIDTFVTLSPIPGFATWLVKEMDRYRSPDLSYDEYTGHGIIRYKPFLSDSVLILSKYWNCDDNEIISFIQDQLHKRSMNERYGHIPNCLPTQIEDTIQDFLECIAAHYIVHVKIGQTTTKVTSDTSKDVRRLKPCNGVARFHLQNGAEVYRINTYADLSPSGIAKSLGVMVNYRYNLSQLQNNQRQYENDSKISIHDTVKAQLR